MYIAGFTGSTDFPVTSGAFQLAPAYDGGDGFVTKLSPQGQIVYSTYLGGGGGSEITSVAVGADGSLYATGETPGSFPVTPGAFQAANPTPTTALNHAFVARLHPAGCGLIYSTYLGGLDFDYGAAIAVDASGDAFVGGATTSADFPTLNPFQGINHSLLLNPDSSFGNGFITELNPAGSSLIYSSFIGGSQNPKGPYYVTYEANRVATLALDGQGNVYLAGGTNTPDFPVVNALQPALGGQINGFVAEVNPAIVPTITFTPPSLSFPNTQSGVTSAPVTVMLANPTASAVSISSIKSDYSDFAVTSQCGSSVASGAQCPITVTFTPSTTNEETGVITVFDNAFAGPHGIIASGMGYTPPTASISMPGYSGNAYTFAAPPGEKACCEQIQVANIGSQPLVVSNVTATGPFTVSNGCSTSLQFGQFCEISVGYTGQSSGTQSGVLSIFDNAANSPQTVPLVGNVQDFSLDASPSSASVNPGQTATYTLALTSLYGLFGNVKLACSNAPSTTTCNLSIPSGSFSPASQISVPLPGNSPLDITVSVLTVGPYSSASKSMLRAPLSGLRSPSRRALIDSLLLAIIALALGARNRRRRSLTPAWALLALLVLWSSCGGGGASVSPPPRQPPPATGTAPGTYNLTVSGSWNDTSGGSITHNITLTLIVK